VAEGSYHEGVTVLPSVTDVAYLPMLTGQYPGAANMPGIRWIDKSRFDSGNVFVAGHRSYMGPAHLRFTDDLPDGLETLFELCPDSLAVRSDIRRGLKSRLNRFYRTSVPFMFFAHYLQRADFVDRIGTGSLLRALRRRKDDLPRFVFLPLIDVDYTSHARGPEHRKTVGAYRRIDSTVGRIIDSLKKRGVWDRTHLLLSSDHGHTETTAHLDLNGLISSLDYSVFEYPNIYRRKVDAALMVSGNSFANIYLPSDGEWQGALTAEELERQHRPLLDELCQRTEIEWIAYRQDDASIKIASAAGIALLGREGESYVYRHEGSDPLQLRLPHTTISDSDALDVTVETRFPDALVQIWQLFDSDRTGDIVVTAKPGYDLRSWREFPEHHGSHGALCWEHMKVPILSNRPLPSNGPARTVDLFPTVVESLGLTPTKPYPGQSLWRLNQQSAAD
jgi:hypothetical protein